jgi:allophanate hydrolase subunit 2
VLVGNAQSAALVESLGGALAFVPSEDVVVGTAGSVARIEIDGCAIGTGQPFAVPAGAEVRIECGEHAARTYVAINGAIRTPLFLGSAAPDPRMGFAQTLAVGDDLLVDTAVTRIDQPYLGQTLFRLPVPEQRLDGDDWTLEIVDCAETETVPGIRELISASEYLVNNSSDHVGIRLDGPVLHPSDQTEIVSHGVPIGAIEIPHSDELIVLGRYRTLTAGYPVVGFVTRRSQDLVGQARPGRALRFSWVDRRAARERAVLFETQLAVLEAATAGAFASLGLDAHAARGARTAPR